MFFKRKQQQNFLKPNRVTARNQDELSFVLPDKMDIHERR